MDGMARLLLVLALLFGLAACGDDDSDEEIFTGVDGEDVVDQVPDDDEVDLDDPAGADDELIDSIEAYARTQIEGDPDELVEARSQGCAEVDTDLPAGAAAADEVAVRDVEAEIDGDEATVSYRLDPADQQVTDERWVREDGEWKWDNC